MHKKEGRETPLQTRLEEAAPRKGRPWASRSLTASRPNGSPPHLPRSNGPEPLCPGCLLVLGQHSGHTQKGSQGKGGPTSAAARAKQQRKPPKKRPPKKGRAWSSRSPSARRPAGIPTPPPIPLCAGCLLFCQDHGGQKSARPKEDPLPLPARTTATQNPRRSAPPPRARPVLALAERQQVHRKTPPHLPSTQGPNRPLPWLSLGAPTISDPRKDSQRRGGPTSARARAICTRSATHKPLQNPKNKG